MVQAFDNLSILSGETEKPRAQDYESYFGEMELDESEKEDRKSLAEKLGVILWALLLLLIEEPDASYYEEMAYNQCLSVAKAFLGQGTPSSYLASHIRKFVQEILETTDKHKDDKWYFSRDRAVLTAENEANVLGNYRQRVQAVKDGKTKKIWRSMQDKYVRHTHVVADGQTVGIFEPFVVGDSLMMFPKDAETYGASMEEIANCRCVCEYL